MKIKDLSNTIQFDGGVDDDSPDVSESTETAGYNNTKYIEKLINEIKADIEKEMVNVDGELCYPQKWINVALLCDVISKEL